MNRSTNRRWKPVGALTLAIAVTVVGTGQLARAHGTEHDGHGKGLSPTIMGVVVSAGAESLSIRKEDGAEAEVRLRAGTRVRSGSEDAAVSDIRAGMRVVVEVDPPGSTSAATVYLPRR